MFTQIKFKYYSFFPLLLLVSLSLLLSFSLFSAFSFHSFLSGFILPLLENSQLALNVLDVYIPSSVKLLSAFSIDVHPAFVEVRGDWGGGVKEKRGKPINIMSRHVRRVVQMVL